MDTNVNIKRFLLRHMILPGGKSRLRVLMLTLLAALLFGATAGLWTGAAFSEALFFTGLKGLVNSDFPLAAQKLFALAATAADNGGLWPLRIFSAVCAWAILLVTYFSARGLYGVNAALLAALVLLTLPLFERFAIVGLPYMLQAALISGLSAVTLTAGTGPIWPWWRWTLFLCFSLLALLFCGLGALGAILPLLLYHFLTLKGKRQLFFSVRIIWPAVVFVMMLAAFFLEAGLRGPEAWSSLRHMTFNFNSLPQFFRLNFWSQRGFELINALGLWLLALALIMFWILRRRLYRKAVNQPYGQRLGWWLAAATLAAVLTPYNNVGRFLGLLPPLAILTGYYLNRYAVYRNALPRSRSALKARAISLKFILTLWGLAICGGGLWLFFNLEQAWQREFYLETGHLIFLIVLGACTIVLSVRSFWIIGRAYAYWGFIIAMLLSFSFIGYGVVVPARDILHTPYYFNQNLKTLLSGNPSGGVTLGVLPQTDRNAILARFFLYADYPVHFVVLNQANFKNLAPVLPVRLILTSDVLAALGDKPRAAGYRPVFWEEVAGTLLIVLERFPAAKTDNVQPLLNLADAAEAGGWPAGYCFAGGYLIPYGSQGQEPLLSPQIVAYPDNNLRIISAGINEGLRDPYVFRWLITSGRAAPRGAYTGLALHFQALHLNERRPYGVGFQQWALAEILAGVQPAFTLFTGLNPQHAHSAKALEKLLQPDKVRSMAFGAPTGKIDFEGLNTSAFLKFYVEGATRLALELPLRK